MTQPQASWIEEFNETISNVMGITEYDSDRIKSFIASALSKKESETKELVVKMIEGMKNKLVMVGGDNFTVGLVGRSRLTPSGEKKKAKKEILDELLSTLTPHKEIC